MQFKNSKKNWAIQELGNGIRFFIRPCSNDKGIIKEVWNRRTYERHGFKIKENSIVVDIGAHIGTFTVYAAKKSKFGKVYSYEPHPESFKLLEENLRINKINNARAYDCAITITKDKSKLFLSKDPSRSNMCENTNDFIFVKTISLKDIFKKDKIHFCDFLKIDTEGAEYEILKQAPKALFRDIDIIVMEYHNIFEKQTVKRLIRLLNRLKFKIKIDHIRLTDVGMIYAKNSFNNNSSQVIFTNILEYYKSRIRFYFNQIIAIDRNIGSVGIMLKKYFPKLYHKLKKLRK